MPRSRPRYPAQYRQQMVDLVRSGRSLVPDRPAPGVRDDETLDALRVPACEVEADRPTPVVHEQGDLAKSRWSSRAARRRA